MRRLATARRIRAFLAALGREATQPATVYLNGGATAVLHGWRESTIDVDLKLVPDHDELLRAIAHLKDDLEINVELASPDLFIPVGRGWEGASPYDSTEGPLTIRHFDLVAQALAKISRGHERDISDVDAMFERGLVDPEAVRRRFDEIEAELYRFPALDASSFRAAMERAVARPN